MSVCIANLAETTRRDREKWRKLCSPFLLAGYVCLYVVAMGVFERAKAASGLSEGADETAPYVCLACGAPHEVQYHRCPDCESFDIRCARWVEE